MVLSDVLCQRRGHGFFCRVPVAGLQTLHRHGGKLLKDGSVCVPCDQIRNTDDFEKRLRLSGEPGKAALPDVYTRFVRDNAHHAMRYLRQDFTVRLGSVLPGLVVHGFRFDERDSSLCRIARQNSEARSSEAQIAGNNPE